MRQIFTRFNIVNINERPYPDHHLIGHVRLERSGIFFRAYGDRSQPSSNLLYNKLTEISQAGILFASPPFRDLCHVKKASAYAPVKCQYLCKYWIFYVYSRGSSFLGAHRCFEERDGRFIGCRVVPDFQFILHVGRLNVENDPEWLTTSRKTCRRAWGCSCGSFRAIGVLQPFSMASARPDNRYV